MRYFALYITMILGISTLLTQCDTSETADLSGKNMNVIFLHHSTGREIWNGGVSDWINKYNQEHGTSYNVVEKKFPKARPYGWKNYPYDYWNIWVNHAGDKPYVSNNMKNAGIVQNLKAFAKSVKNGNLFEEKGEPTLEILTKSYDVIVWKHCFPVSDMRENTGNPDIASEEKRAENYKLQYGALKEKMHQFPDTKFLVWTGAARVKNQTNPESARRAQEFFEWVRNEWNEPEDNIYLWDFRRLETEGGLYLKQDYAAGANNSHPNEEFASRVAPLFARRIVQVLEGRGDTVDITGKD